MRTSTTRAMTDRRDEVAYELIKAGADVNATNHFGDTALHYAVRCRLNKIVRALLAAGANDNAEAGRYDQETPVFWAYNVETLRLLLAAGANVEALDRHGRTPLMWFVKRHRWEVAEEALQHGATVTDPQLLFTVVDLA